MVTAARAGGRRLMRRGLTMVETLVSLGILSALLLVVAAWTRVATQASAAAAATGHWELAAEAVLDLIHVDLESGDAVPARPGRGQPDQRVAVEDGALRIRTRSTGTGDARGSAIHSYILRSGTLRREQRADDGNHRERPLLDDVSAWTCEIDKEERLLSIAITTHAGTLVRRIFRLP